MNPYTPSADDICKLVSAGIMTKDEARRALKLPVAEKPWWISETPWFGKLTAEEAADMEVGFYGVKKSRPVRFVAKRARRK